MSLSEFVLEEKSPSAIDFASLRRAVGWKNPELPVIQRSINTSLYWASIFKHRQLIACGRLIGDGAMYFYVQDVVVHPDYQKLGLGDKIMQSINGFISIHCPGGSTIGLLAAKGKEDFYRKHGFTSRNGNALGLGMCKFI